MTRRRPDGRGFTLLEVMVALAILALALTAIVGINGNAIRSHEYAKRITVATMLARSKMTDIQSKYRKEGFTSEFDQKMEGDFSEEGWPDYRWEAEIVKPDIDGKNASALVESLVQKLMGDYEDKMAENEDIESSSAPSSPTMDAGSIQAMLGPMIETQVTALTEVVKQSVREIRLKILWKNGTSEDSFDVVTHLVILAPAEEPK